MKVQRAAVRVVYLVALVYVVGVFGFVLRDDARLRVDEDQMARQMLLSINYERQAEGRDPLIQDAALVQVARTRAEDMAANVYLAHRAPDGSDVFDLLNGLHYAWGIGGENVARNDYPDAQAAQVSVEGFMGSASHRENVLERRFSRVGIAVARTADDMKYFVVVFTGD